MRDSHHSTGTHTTCCSLKQQQNTHRLCPLSGTTRVSRYQKGYLTNLDFTEARDSEWQWNQLGHMQVCTSLQTDNHTSTPPLGLFTGRMPFLPPDQQRQGTKGLSLVNQCLFQAFLGGRGFPASPQNTVPVIGCQIVCNRELVGPLDLSKFRVNVKYPGNIRLMDNKRSKLFVIKQSKGCLVAGLCSDPLGELCAPQTP